MVDVIQYLDVILLNSELESHSEEQDWVVIWWAGQGYLERSVMHCCCSGLHPGCECGWLVCYKSCWERLNFVYLVLGC